jgi:hypothetical protein
VNIRRGFYAAIGHVCWVALFVCWVVFGLVCSLVWLVVAPCYALWDALRTEIRDATDTGAPVRSKVAADSWEAEGNC